MKRIGILIVAVLVAGAVVVATASAHAHAAATAKVQVHSSGIGKILVNSSGFTLYMFSKDSKNKDACQKISGCTSIWPPLTTSGSPTAGSGVKRSLLGTIKLSNGSKQVTYAGHPLYTYSGDSRGETDYVGAHEEGGVWNAVNAAGHSVG